MNIFITFVLSITGILLVSYNFYDLLGNGDFSHPLILIILIPNIILCFFSSKKEGRTGGNWKIASWTTYLLVFECLVATIAKQLLEANLDDLYLKTSGLIIGIWVLLFIYWKNTSKEKLISSNN